MISRPKWPLELAEVAEQAPRAASLRKADHRFDLHACISVAGAHVPRGSAAGDPPEHGSGSAVPGVSESLIRFGPFSLAPGQRTLCEAGQPVRLGSRALQILLFLIEHVGEFVTNDQIVQYVWPRNVVVEGNVRVHIASLRKALGDGQEGRRFIVNVPNRGYCFVGEVRRERAGLARTPTLRVVASTPGLALPAPLGRIVGQERAIVALGEQMLSHRLLTVVGTGGIGKTTVALAAAARDEVQMHWSNVHFVDLAAHSDPALVPAALAQALGLGTAVDDAQSSLIAFLHDKSPLIIFDNCEHLVAPLAILIEDILRRAPAVHILATSREPLGAQGEWVVRLQPLTVPPAGARLTARELMQFSAVELFVDRCAASVDQFSLQDADAEAVGTICRRLDGLPLAIELAAARVGSLGIKRVATELDDRLTVLSRNRRTAMPRHRSLRATLDWSFELLSQAERRLMLRLSIFAGSFTLDAALAVTADEALSFHEVVDAVSELVAKSLLVVDASADELTFRLLETTRAYAAEQLALHAEESTGLRRRHAAFFLALLERSELAWRSTPVADFIATFGHHLDDIRSAICWAFEADGDGALGIALVTKAAPLLFQMSFTDEHRQYVERALAYRDQATEALDPRQEVELCVVAGNVIFYAHGLHPDRDRLFARAAELAERIGDPQLMAVACSAQWMSAYQTSNPRRMLEHAQQFATLTAGTEDLALALHRDRILVPTWHLYGNQLEALACCERGMADPSVIRAPFFAGVRIDRRVAIGCIHARVLWLLGRPEQAERAIVRALDAAEREQEPVAVASSLAFSACPLAIWAGNLPLARQRLDRLLRLTAERALRVWHEYGVAFQAYIQWLESGASGLPPAPPASLERVPQLAQLMATFHPHHVTNRVFEIGEAGFAGWCHAELLRVRGDRLRESDPEASEKLLHRALDIALRDQTPPWALRAAVSIARSWCAQGRAVDAVALLTRTLALQSEGPDTPEVSAARAMRSEAEAIAGGSR